MTRNCLSLGSYVILTSGNVFWKHWNTSNFFKGLRPFQVFFIDLFWIYKVSLMTMCNQAPTKTLSSLLSCGPLCSLVLWRSLNHNGDRLRDKKMTFTILGLISKPKNIGNKSLSVSKCNRIIIKTIFRDTLYVVWSFLLYVCGRFEHLLYNFK